MTEDHRQFKLAQEFCQWPIPPGLTHEDLAPLHNWTLIVRGVLKPKKEN